MWIKLQNDSRQATGWFKEHNKNNKKHFLGNQVRSSPPFTFLHDIVGAENHWTCLQNTWRIKWWKKFGVRAKMFWGSSSVYSSLAYCSYAHDEEDGDGDEELEQLLTASVQFYLQDRTFAKMIVAKSLRCNCLSLLNTTHSSGTHSFILNTLCYHIWQIDNFKSPLLYTESCKIIPQTFLNNNQTGRGHHLTRHLKAQPFKATKTSRRLINREPDTKVRRLTHRFAHLLFGNVNLAQEVPLKQKLAEPKANNTSPLNSGPTVFFMLLGSTLTRLSFQTV